MTDTPKPSLYAKLAEVMREIGYVEKRGFNDFHKYAYVTEADLVDAVRAKLAERNVVVIPSLSGIDERGVTNAKGKASTITTARVAFTFCDGDSGQTHTAEWAGAGDDPADKGLYKAYTGAVKYFLMKSFLIPTGDDPEADSGTDERSSGGQSSRRDVKRDGTSDIPSDVKPPENIGAAKAAELLLNSDSAGISREALQKATAWALGVDSLPESFESDEAALYALAQLTGVERTMRWIEKQRTKTKETVA